MGDIINLRSARKARERASARAQADENAAKFGRRKGDKALAAALAEKARQTLDAHRRGDATDSAPGGDPEK